MFKLFKNFTKRDWLIVLVCVIFITFQVWLDLKLPDYMSNITRLIQTEGSSIKEILKSEGEFTFDKVNMALYRQYIKERCENQYVEWYEDYESFEKAFWWNRYELD